MQNVVADRTARARAGRGGRAGALWLFQAISGLLLVLLLGLHMLAHHFVAEGGLRDFEQVKEYVSNPVIMALEIIFLLVVTPHAVLGIQSVLLDLGPSERAKQGIAWVLGLVTVVTLVYGIWLALTLQQQ